MITGVLTIMVNFVLFSVLCLICLIPGSLLESKPPSVKILVIGRTGSGKSTLINNILGRKIASVGDRPYPETTTVSVYKQEIYGVSVTVCDTPGLGDASGKDENYMKKIKASCDDPDLVIFCQSMDNTRWQTDDEIALKTVTRHLGTKIWEHSVLVLTFADRFIANLRNEVDKLEAFKQRQSDLKRLFKGALEEIKVPHKQLYNATSARGPIKLPGMGNWMTNLMITCLAATHENGKEGFRQIIVGRLADPHQEDEEPLTWTDTLCNLMQKNDALWVGSILGIKVGGYIAGKLLVGRIALALSNPVGAIVGLVAGYSLQYIISSATCSNFNSQDKDEL